MRDDVHISHLKFYRDSEIDREAIVSHVPTSGIGMIVPRFMGLDETPTGICVRVRWRGLPSSEETLAPNGSVETDVPQLLQSFSVAIQPLVGLLQTLETSFPSNGGL